MFNGIMWIVQIYEAIRLISKRWLFVFGFILLMSGVSFIKIKAMIGLTSVESYIVGYAFIILGLLAMDEESNRHSGADT